MIVTVIFTLPDAEAFRQAGQLIIFIQVANLKHVAGVVIDILDCGITFHRHDASHGFIQVRCLCDPSTRVILIRLSRITIRKRDDIHVVIPHTAHTAVKSVVYVNNTVVAIHQPGRYAFMVIPGFFSHIVVVIVFIGLITICIFLKSRLVVFIKPGFTQQVAVTVPVLLLLRIADPLHEEVTLTIRIFFRQEMSTDIIGICLLSISFCGDNRFPIRAEECFSQQVALGVILTLRRSVITTEHVRCACFIKIFFAQQSVVGVILTAHFRSTGINISYMTICTIVHFAGCITVLIVFTDKGGVAIRAFGGSAVLVKILFTQLVTFIIPFIFLLMITGSNLHRLIPGAIIGNAPDIAHIVSEGFLDGIS